MKDKRKVRVGVVGLGHIAQVAVLPAFKNVKNAELTALISGDETKLQKLSKLYGIDKVYNYDSFEECLKANIVDAVYIALPNHLHREFVEIASDYKIHVLCEKPMALETWECREMIDAVRRNNIKLMIGYRLHFDKANLLVLKKIKSGVIGKPKIFNSTLTMQVRDKDNIRLKQETGGGSLYDIGIYCINAARHIFQSEPVELSALTATTKDDERFAEVNEMVSGVMRFPDDQLATFTCSFGASDSGNFEVIGTKGSLRMESAYEYAEPMKLFLTKNEKTTVKTFPKHDQFAAEIEYFSDCILKNKEIGPSGQEGVADVKIINALYKSAREGMTLAIKPKRLNPLDTPIIVKPPVKKPREIHVNGPGD